LVFFKQFKDVRLFFSTSMKLFKLSHPLAVTIAIAIGAIVALFKPLVAFAAPSVPTATPVSHSAIDLSQVSGDLAGVWGDRTQVNTPNFRPGDRTEHRFNARSGCTCPLCTGIVQ
jgi:hypothetical protein